MKKIFVFIFAIALLSGNAKAWNGGLHAAVADIAHHNLTEEARAGIAKCLDGYSIVYEAQWLDDVSKSEEYKHVKTWHNVPVTASCKVIPAKKAAKSKVQAINEAGALEALYKAVEVLKNRDKHSKETVADNIRYVVYIMGDLHCPSHYVYEDRIANRDYNYYYGKEKKPRSYMKFWEAAAITDTFNWKTNEFVHQLSRLPQERVAELTAGTLTAWIERNAAEYRFIYDLMPEGQRLKKDDYREWLNNFYPLATDHIGVAGYRLAALLNGLFDVSQPAIKTK